MGGKWLRQAEAERRRRYDSREGRCEQTLSTLCPGRREKQQRQDGLLASNRSELYFISRKVANEKKSLVK